MLSVAAPLSGVNHRCVLRVRLPPSVPRHYSWPVRARPTEGKTTAEWSFCSNRFKPAYSNCFGGNKLTASCKSLKLDSRVTQLGVLMLNDEFCRYGCGGAKSRTATRPQKPAVGITWVHFRYHRYHRYTYDTYKILDKNLCPEGVFRRYCRYLMIGFSDLGFT